MGIRVLKSGVFTTVQDLGRMGYQSSGFSTSGVMDQRAFKIANLLIDNPENEAGLELTLTGPTLEFTSATIIAITGGDFSPKINQVPVPMYTAIYANKGDILTFGPAKTGCRGYIAFSSKLDIPVVMGSRSTNTKCGIGGFKGRALRKGDYINFRVKKRYLPRFLSRSLALQEYDNKDVVLRVVLGPQEDAFTTAGLTTFLSEKYRVTLDCDRMGYRLEGPQIEYKDSVDIISDGIAFGSIQIPSHGRPIIMLSDRQTTGGYAKIATVISSDIPQLVQRKDGDIIHFKGISVEEAQKIYRNEVAELDNMRRQILAPCREVLEPRPTAKRLRSLFK